MIKSRTNAFEALHRQLCQFIPESRLIRDPLRTLAYGTDASFYRLIPQLVVEAEDEDEVVRILQCAASHGTSVTFRAAGTSLSGQAITDSVLLRVGTGWRGWRINEDATLITLQPGVVGGDANRYLAPYGRKIGPDPASINAAKIGGIAANNASGMCCGVAQNSYQTLHSMRLVLADGAVLDTGSEASRAKFRSSHGQMLDALERLGRETRQNAQLAARIRDKFRIKNTTGYSVNALIDYEDAIDILQHLIIGSEGTLGFISEITYQTVEEHAHKASALVFFPTVQVASKAVALLKSEPVAAVELMDRAAIRSVEHKPGMPASLADLPDAAAALLIETRAGDVESLESNIGHIAQGLDGVQVVYPIEFTDVPEEFQKLWAIRKGAFPSVGAVREPGTTVIIEDVAFPVEKLAEATLDLQNLFEKHHYHEAVIFGHALEGNLHFVFTQDFGTSEEVQRYRHFMDDVCDLVVKKYDGSLKAEHSTGRNMAPFVEMEWGGPAYALMRQIKTILDPEELLNPGVILNDDPEIHLKDLKPMPPVHEIVDKCIECGFCEPSCPSRALSLTPRQRIVGLREMARLEANGEDGARLDALRLAYQYQGIDTCAGDSLCSIACPVGIDTGRMMKSLRGDALGARGGKVAAWLGDHFAMVSATTRAGLAAANIAHGVLGTKAMSSITRGARNISGDRIPLWNPAMPRAAKTPAAPKSGARQSNMDLPAVLYFPSCASRTMGPARGDSDNEPLTAIVESILGKAGFRVLYPDHLDHLCCGMPFESKGAFAAADAKTRELEQALVQAIDDGARYVVFDTSPCAFRTSQSLRSDVPVYELTEFIHDVLLDRLDLTPCDEIVAIHPTCSNRKMGSAEKLQSIAEACAARVIVPEDVPCCGWAGDKGFTTPELNASATRNLRRQLPDDCVAGYSSSRTCEIGLSYHSGRPYRSIAYLVDRCARRPGVAE